ncbi:REP-associated tyrosine transposase [Flammeovirga aprica]|uniref:Transposase n=1 Tax=Flammeovirga aprica JL-4 TaxID=694437 RepID=A0A7X9P399_9BACT|nr:transposase [Flammeovirga aprica]NME68756.1 transposase [Flammeovirga aprica JL-4]
MSRKYKFNDQTKCYFVTLTVTEWVDVFTRKEYIDIIIDSLTFCQKNKGLQIHSYVIMTNHLHLIISTKEGGEKLEFILRDFKKYTSQNIRKAIEQNPKESRKKWMLWLFKSSANPAKQNFQFWQHYNFPIQLSSPKLLDQKMNYIHNNPVRSGVVNEPEEYMYSSARHYSGKKYTVLEIDFV